MRASDHSYLWHHPRSPVLWYRRDVPKDVQAWIGKTRWKRSLRSAVRADAIREARKLAVQHDADIEQARRANGVADLSRLTPTERAVIAEAGGVAGYLSWLEQRARDAEAAKREATWIREGVAENSKAPAPDADDIDPDWAVSRTAGLDAERRAIEHQLGQSTPTLEKLGATSARLNEQKRHALATLVAGGLIDRDTITLSGVLARWEKAKGPTAPEQFRYPVRLFEDMHGRIPVATITKAHVREFRDALPELPRAGGVKFSGLPLHSLIELADRKALPRINGSTAAKYHRAIKTILSFAVSDGYLIDNPASGIQWHGQSVSYSETEENKRRSFAPAEYRKLLAFAEATKAGKPDDLWFLRLAIWSGARGEELAQLAPGDIKKVGGVFCLDFHDRGDNHLKTRSSARKVPVHPALLSAGFEAFVDQAKGPRLFPSLKANGKGRLYSRMGARLTRLIKSAGITDKRVKPYSTRHSFKDALELVQAPEYVAEAIMGHNDPDHRTARGYGEDQVRVMAEWMAKVDPLDIRRTVTEFVADGDEET